MSVFPAKEPRLDEWSSAAAGQDLELLSGISARQPYASAGPWVDAAALQLLQDLAGGTKLGRFGMRGREPEVEQLAEAGLVTAAGKLTPQGQAFVRPLQEGSGLIEVHADAGGRRSRLLIWLGRHGATLAAGPSYHRLLETNDDGAAAGDADAATVGARAATCEAFQLDHVPADAVPGSIGRWIGLAPAWSIAGTPEILPPDVLNARLHDETAPAPAEADAKFLRAWSEPWVTYQLLIEPGGFKAGFINAAAAGFYRYGSADGGAGLSPLPSGSLWSLLTARVSRALAA